METQGNCGAFEGGGPLGSTLNTGSTSESTKPEATGFKYDRLPKALQGQLKHVLHVSSPQQETLALDRIYLGDAVELLPKITANSVALSVWSPPYFVGKSYESDLQFEDWEHLLETVISQHWPIVRPGGFLAINIADILCFRDTSMPRIQAHNSQRHRSLIRREHVLEAMARYPAMNRYQLAAFLGCSEQTIDRRLNGNNIRGGKYETQTRLKLVGGLLERWALKAGFYPYDRRVWVKDACWENSRWASLSYRSVDEFEYIYIFWKPGITKVDRSRLSVDEWSEWGSRGVWFFPSVRANDDHEAKFPIELPSRVIRLLTDVGDTVLDCFAGSGTTAVAAKTLRRRYIGIELMKEYVTLAEKRLAENALPFGAARAQSSQAKPRRVANRKGTRKPSTN
jgi:site-specific DNA-methyltransferase (adenine-specific)